LPIKKDSKEIGSKEKDSEQRRPKVKHENSATYKNVAPHHHFE
jgi:hypothetical protein